MRQKTLTSRKIAVTFLTVLLALCLAVGMMFVPGVANGAEGDGLVEVPVRTSVWNGDLAAAGWGVEHTAPVTGIAVQTSEDGDEAATQAEESTKPAGYVATFDDTDATKVKTVTINDAAAFAYFAREIYEFGASYEGVTVTLNCDVDLNNKLWIPIGFDHRKQGGKILQYGFKGTFDGGEGRHTVYNFNGNAFLNAIAYVEYKENDVDKIDYFVESGSVKLPLFLDDNEFHYGLFGAIGNSTIKNLNINDFKFDFAAVKAEKNDDKITSLIADSIGAVAGFVGGSLTVENCTVGNAKTEQVNINGTAVAGGIVGRAYTSYSDSGAYGAGATTDYKDVVFKNCVNYLNIGSREGGDTVQKGGILGYVSFVKTILFEDCKNYGDLYGQFIGGIVSYIQQGQNAESVEFVNCRNEGDLTATSYCNGGIIGRLLTGAERTLINCVNTGDLHTYENAALATTGTDHQFTGGIVGQIESSLTYKLTMSGVYNYGNIIGAGKEQTNGGKPYSYAGGIVGDMRLTEPNDPTTAWISGGRKDEDYPYYTTELSDIVNLGEVSAEGDYVGKNMYIGGLFGAISSNQGESRNTTRISAKNLVNAYGAVNDIDYIGNIAHDTRDGFVRRSWVVSAADEVSVAQLKLSDDGKTLLGLTDTAGAVKVVVPNTVTAIADGAFCGMGTLWDKGYVSLSSATTQRIFQVETAKVVAVEFEEGSTLTTIGALAFAGTDIKYIELPDSVSEIGAGAFAGTQLERVVINSSAAIGDMAFGNTKLKQADIVGNVTFGKNVFNGSKDALVIVKDSASYAENKDADFKDLLTYVVTIEYYDLSASASDVAASEVKLFGKPYTMSYNKETGLWQNNAAIDYVGSATLGAGNTAWYNSDTCNGVSLNVDTIVALLNGDDLQIVKLYTRGVGASDEFVARTDLVYDGTEYSLGAINALLASRSKKVTTETVAITAYRKVGATEAETTAPDSFRNAGTYTVSIGDAEITIVIAQAKIYLANLSTLEWRVNGNITLLDRDGFIDSVVRSRGANVEYTLSLYNTAAKGYAVSDPTGNVNTGAGEYSSTFTLTADDNHEFVAGTILNAEVRGLSVTLNDNGTVTVVKAWRVVDMDNWFIGADNDDYAVADRVYASETAFTAPRLMHGDANDITLELYKDGAPVGQAFTVAELNKYLNGMIPVGSYTLRMSAKAVDYDEYDEYDNDGNPVESSKRTLHCAAFSHEVTFIVSSATLNATQLAAIDDALNGKTFKFIVGAAEMSADNAAAQTAVNAALEQLRLSQPAVTVDGNVWTANTANITVNPAAAMSNVYGEFTKPTTAGVYNYYYKVSLANYNTVDTADNKLLCFTVAAYEYVDLPSVADLAQNYTGEKLTANIVGSAAYTIKENNGGVNVGEYDVVFELIHPEYTLWKGMTLNDNTSTHTVKFVINKSSNDWIEAPDIVRWVEGKYNEEENTFIGAAKFGAITYIITDTNDNVLYDAAQGINELASAKAGTYILKATVVGTDNYNGLSEAFTIRILEKVGLPWWGTLAITVGALLVAALIILILWKKGVFQILTGKLVLAIRTKATIDATIAAVRASKVAARARETVAEAKAREAAEERAEARKKAAEAERNKPVDERVASLEAKAQETLERAEIMKVRAEKMQSRVASMKKRVQKQSGEDGEASETPDDNTEE